MPSIGTGEKGVRIVVLGSAGVGKSALCQQFVHGTFDDCYDPTLEDSYRRVIELPNCGPLLIEVMDTAGTEQFAAALRELYLRTGDAFLLVYSIDRANSWEALQTLFEDIQTSSAARHKPLRLVGNKSDLEGERQVSKSRVRSQLVKWKLEEVAWETSARLNHNVEEVFRDLIEATLIQRRDQGNKGNKGKSLPLKGQSSKCITM